ncbi:putative transcriptional regulator [Cardiobacterium hominis]|uniref:Putative transcriptional regulator n=1 Tax=Cardiobacterium hominis TaxID=2718 RepID=A0A1C3H797_9GAMM|nr:helix-turn-helix transcriptional regulator [Cardiobacterium hominis]SAM71762.1 putative transcriptional regulator [Cardiobacterium hominis]
MKNFTVEGKELLNGSEQGRFTKEAVGERLRDARNAANLTLKEVAAIDGIGISRNALQQWETGATEASIAAVYRLAQVYQADPLVLLSGERRATVPVQASNDDYYYIPAYEIEASAGHGAFTEGATTPAKHLAFRKDWVHDRRLSPSSLSAIFTRGDSMEPTIPDGATILVDSSRIEPLDGKIYVIRIDDRLWVKRVQWILGGGLRLISDNRIYSDIDVSKADLEHADVQICGQVVYVSYDFPE